VAIDLQKVEGLSANTVEFAVLVQNNGVTETVAELCAHDCQCKVFGISMLDGFRGSKSLVIPEISTRYVSKPSKLECFSAE
jgi:hypothetical protein